MSTPSRRVVLGLALLGLCVACNDGTSAGPSSPANASGDGAKVGAPAPPLDVPSAVGGGRLTIPKGKVVIVDFWATWCAPCKASFPKYQDLYTKYKASGLEILAVSADEPDNKAEIPGFVKTYGAKFPVGWEPERSAPKAWGVTSTMPTAFIVDKQGIVRHKHEKFEAGDAEKIEKMVKELL